jgi:hypothetical protein
MNLNEREKIIIRFIYYSFNKPMLPFSNEFECFVERRKEIGSDI